MPIILESEEGESQDWRSLGYTWWESIQKTKIHKCKSGVRFYVTLCHNSKSNSWWWWFLVGVFSGDRGLVWQDRDTLTMKPRLASASCISLLRGRITLEFEKQTVVFIHSIHKSTIRAQFCYLQYFLCSLVFQQPCSPVTRQYELTTRFRDDGSCSLNRKPPKQPQMLLMLFQCFWKKKLKDQTWKLPNLRLWLTWRILAYGFKDSFCFRVKP